MAAIEDLTAQALPPPDLLRAGAACEGSRPGRATAFRWRGNPTGFPVSWVDAPPPGHPDRARRPFPPVPLRPRLSPSRNLDYFLQLCRGSATAGGRRLILNSFPPWRWEASAAFQPTAGPPPRGAFGAYQRACCCCWALSPTCCFTPGGSQLRCGNHLPWWRLGLLVGRAMRVPRLPHCASVRLPIRFWARGVRRAAAIRWVLSEIDAACHYQAGPCDLERRPSVGNPDRSAQINCLSDRQYISAT